MDNEAKIDQIKKGTMEIITPEELKEKLKKKEPIAYTGYEPSGKIHLGHVITVIKLKQLQKMGFKIKILFADYHAYLNGKGTIDEIKKTVEYNKKCFKVLGLSEDTDFVLGSSFQTTVEYVNELYNLSTLTTLIRARRSMDKISRNSENPKVADAIYPLMQVADMIFLDVDVALGGMEQRKIQMLARENLPKINKKVPVCIHTPLLSGLDGDEKMSSSKENFISIDESEEEIKNKINKSFCPIKESGNPIIEIATHFIFTNQEKLLIKRADKFGGDLELSKNELLDIYCSGKLHPMDLKNAVANYLINYLANIRENISK
jgi:tyrosyl-tRNA synthetase